MTNASDSDYFSGVHKFLPSGQNNTARSLEGLINAPNESRASESNPFERDFSGAASLPSLANGATNGTGEDQNLNLAPITPGNGTTTPGGAHKLPTVEPSQAGGAMLSPGPLMQTPSFWSMGTRSPMPGGYFDLGNHGSFPTPNESMERTGMTPGATGLTPGGSGMTPGLMSPGGSGSMFPPPTMELSSPNGNLKTFLRSGDVTPGTYDFQHTAMRAQQQRNITSQPTIDQAINRSIPVPHSSVGGISTMTAEVKPEHPEEHSETNDAAIGLFSLRSQAPYTMAPQTTIQPVHAHPPNMPTLPQSAIAPQMGHRNNGSISTQGAGSADMSGSDAEESPKKRKTRGGVKKEPANKQSTNGGRSNGATAKGPANKRRKTTNNHIPSASPEPEEEEMDLTKDEFHANGKKMSDEEKRKNFLERNRVAALKCRQRKKQWLQNLQHKVEAYAAENENLNSRLAAVNEEMVQLKTILLAHKECPVSAQQGLGGNAMVQFLSSGYAPGPDIHSNPYGMAMGSSQQQQQQQNPMMVGPRRFS